jgi:predicted lipoprotein with Yx(FWY)xxD motif
MIYVKRSIPFSIALLIMMALAACGSSTTTGSGSTPTPVATTPTPVATTPAAVATTPATSSAIIMTATATVKGTSETILTDAQGKTLYYLMTDTATASTCTGGCAGAWPPLLFTGSGTPTSSTTLPGKLTVVSAGNGNQVEYNGHLLYTFASDSAPGQTNGEGVGNKWHVATPNLT